MKKNNTEKNKIMFFWNKLPWTTKGIFEGIIIGLIFLFLVWIATLSSIWPENWVVPWLYLFIALMLIGIIFQLIEIRLVKKKNRL